MTRFANIQNQLCISPQAIAEACAPYEQSFNTVKKGLVRYRNGGSNYWKHYDDAHDGRKKWVVVDTIPDVYGLRLEHHYGSLELAYLQELLVERAVSLIDTEDAPYFLSLEARKGGKGFSSEQAADLAEACGWLRLASSEWWTMHWSGKLAFFDAAAQVIKLRDLYGFKIGNGRTYGRRLKRWQKSGRDSLVPGYVGNSNAAKITDLGLKRLIDLYSSPQKPEISKVTAVYNAEAVEQGWEALTEERVRQLVRMPDNRQISFGHRHGTEATRNVHERTIKRRRPSFADALWVLDGTSLQLLFLENGVVRSDMYVYFVLDAYSEAIIGFAVRSGYGEPAVLVQEALRQACKSTMHLPVQLQYDNASGNKSAEVSQLMEKISKMAFPTAPYNGKAKVIERVQGEIENTMLRYWDNWKGGNITAKSLRTSANKDHLDELRRTKNLPTREGAVAQLMLSLELWNNTADRHGVTRLEKYQRPHEKRRPVEYLTLVDLFWVQRPKKATYTKDGLTIEVDKERYTYEVERSRGLEDMDFRRQYLGERFDIKYDPAELEYINLYQDGTWIATARQKYEVAMAIVDREEGEGEIIRQAIEDRKAYLAENVRRMEEIKAEVRAEGFPVLSHQLVHKEAYNRMEQEYLNELLGIIEERPEAAQKTRKTTAVVALYEGDDADGAIID